MGTKSNYVVGETIAELTTDVGRLREELLKLRLAKQSQQLQDVTKLKKTRRNLARTLTALNASVDTAPSKGARK